MSKEVVEGILSLLRGGAEPVFKLHPRRGKDVRVMRITGTDGRNFHGVLIDSKKEQTVVLPHLSIIHGTITVEEVKEDALPR